jgi:hypothetical protein
VKKAIVLTTYIITTVPCSAFLMPVTNLQIPSYLQRGSIPGMLQTLLPPLNRTRQDPVTGKVVPFSKILLVDDNLDHAHTLRSTLRSLFRSSKIHVYPFTTERDFDLFLVLYYMDTKDEMERKYAWRELMDLASGNAQVFHIYTNGAANNSVPWKEMRMITTLGGPPYADIFSIIN